MLYVQKSQLPLTTKKLNTSIMATMNVNSLKKNWLIQFTSVTTGEIDYILSRIGSKTGEIAPESRLVGAVVSMFFHQPEPGKPVHKNIKVRRYSS
jgi:hypothetical protein